MRKSAICMVILFVASAVGFAMHSKPSSGTEARELLTISDLANVLVDTTFLKKIRVRANFCTEGRNFNSNGYILTATKPFLIQNLASINGIVLIEMRMPNTMYLSSEFGDSLIYDIYRDNKLHSRAFVRDGKYNRVDDYYHWDVVAIYQDVIHEYKAKADSVLDNLVIIPIEKGSVSPQ